MYSLYNYPNSYRIYRIERLQMLNERIDIIESELISSKTLSGPRSVYLHACLDDCYKELESL